ncbi:MAG: hypothetical protein Kow0089_03160 [Desulfobulbaceae bacterium]
MMCRIALLMILPILMLALSAAAQTKVVVVPLNSTKGTGPAGSDGQVQYNDSGQTAGAQVYYDKATGNLGVRTPGPLMDIHVTSGDTPTLRLEQDASQDWIPQTWDISGNDALFSINDVTFSTHPLRIETGAPDDSLYVTAGGDVEVTNGYLQLAVTSKVPLSTDCDETSEFGRMKVDAANKILYICVQGGWSAHAL